MLSAFAWAGFLLSLIGVWLLTRHLSSGWTFRLAAGSCWLVYAVGTGQVPLVAEALVFLVVDSRGLAAWRNR